jgi:hypothetical protein
MIQQIGEACEFELAKQIGHHAFYAKVTIIVSPQVKGSDCLISIDSEVDRRWHSAVSFGIEYAWERVRRESAEAHSVAVQVIAVDWQPSDSTMMTVAFSAAHALWKALKHTPGAPPELDALSGRFSFPN